MADAVETSRMAPSSSLPVPRTLVLADPSHATTGPLAREFTKLGSAEVWLAEDANKALNLVIDVKAELLVLELRLADHGGLALLRDVVNLSPRTTCVIHTAYGSVSTAVRAIRLGAKGYLTKPASAVDILRTVLPDDWSSAAGDCPEQHMSLHRATWEYLNRVFQDAGSVSEAARRLGMDRSSLRRMLGRYAPPK
jgi:two-component system, response regulator RegA